MPNLPKEQSQQDPTGDELAKAKAKAKAAEQRAEDARRDEVNDIVKLHSVLVEKLATASAALESASNISEEIQQHLKKRTFSKAETELDREIVRVMRLKLDRMLRVTEVVRTVNAARMHVTRIRRGSLAVGRAVREWTDELVRPSPGGGFE